MDASRPTPGRSPGVVGYLKMDVRDLVRRVRGRAAREVGPSQAELTGLSREGHLRLVGEAGRLVFFSTLARERLFSIPGRLAGSLGTFVEGDGGKGRRVVLTVPLELAGLGRRSLKVTFQGPSGIEPGEDLQLARAGEGRLPPQSRFLEFLFARGEQEFRYLVEMDADIPVEDFREVADTRPLFRSIPPVAQMTAFLRAIIHQRRNALRILADLAGSWGSPATRAAVALMEQLFRAHYEFGGPVLEGLRRLLLSQDISVSPAVLAATCFFFDLERGALTPALLEKAAQNQEEPPCSLEAGLACALRFGARVDAETWSRFFPEGDFEDLRRAVEEPPLKELRGRLADPRRSRTALQILEELARESHSTRAGAFVRRLRQKLPSGELAPNDEQRALGLLLAASGRPVNPNTLTALCLFVDMEIAHLGEEHLDLLVEDAARYDTSIYAMVAVAGAFDTSLRGFTLTEAEPRVVESLLALAQGGLLAGFRRPGEGGTWWEWLSTPQDFRRVLEQKMEFAGLILGRFPVIDQLSERDLEALLAPGRPLLACFYSDLDRGLIWQKMNSGDQAAHLGGGRYGFVEGPGFYSFNRLVMASLAPCRDEDLVGAEKVVAVYADARGNHHYRYYPILHSPADLAPPEGSGLTWTHLVVEFPDLQGLPERLEEMGQERLLGRSETLSREVALLRDINQALQSILLRHPEYCSLHQRPELFERVLKAQESAEVASALQGLVDPRIREGLVRRVRQGEGLEVRVYAPLAEVHSSEEVDFLALRLMFELCRDERVELAGFFKQYDESRFRSLLHNRLFELIHSPDPHTRLLALRLLATSDQAADRNHRMVAEFELSQALSDPDPAVARGACEGLARLALMDHIPLPQMMRIATLPAEKPAPEPPSLPGVSSQVDGDQVASLASQVARWARDLRLRDPERARGLPFTDEGGEIVEERLAPLLELLAGLNQTFRADGSLELRRYLAVSEPEATAGLRRAILESWKVFALSQGRRLAELVAETAPEELFLDHTLFLQAQGQALAWELGFAPYLGGPGRPLRIFHLRPQERVEVWRRKESSFVQQVLEESPLFLELVELSRRQDPRRLRVYRLSRAGGMDLEDLESHLPVFTTERVIDPRDIQIFQLNRLRFAPLIHEMCLTLEQMGGSEEDFEDYQAMLALFQGRAAGPPATAPDEEANPFLATLAPPEPPPRPRLGVRELAALVGRAFGLPESYDRHLLKVLMAIGPRAVYDL